MKGLEALDKIIEMALEPNGYINFQNAVDTPYYQTIEKELKEYEKYKELENKLGCSFEELLADNVFGSTQIGLAIINNLVTRNNELRKKAKALRIIKNMFDISFNDKDNEIMFNDDDGLLFARSFKDKEKYELLKEVLL